MAHPRLSKYELRIMEILWTHGPLSVRQVQTQFPPTKRPAYTTVQTMIVRLEAKKAVQRTGAISKAHVFEAAISRSTAQRRLVDDFLGLFGGRVQPLMAHLVESRKLTLEDVQEAEKLLQNLAAKGRSGK